MQKEMLIKANEIISLIDEHEKAVQELEKYAQSGKAFCTKLGWTPYRDVDDIPKLIRFEDWEMRLMIHNKKQRISALKYQLERL